MERRFDVLVKEVCFIKFKLTKIARSIELKLKLPIKFNNFMLPQNVNVALRLLSET